MYTGGLENHPELVDRISARRPLWGNSGDVLRRVRDPVQLADALSAAQLAHPAIAVNAARLPRDGSWLVKRRHGSGGRHVRPWNVRTGTLPGPPDDWYFQERVEGTPCSGVFLAAGDGCRLLGVTRQLIGPAWTHAGRWQYAGSIGPLMLAERRLDEWRRIGRCLAESFRLTGLFGVDAVADASCVRPVEVNPRYTASVEILERAFSIAAIAWHANACRDGGLPDFLPPWPQATCGKAILYARTNYRVSAETTESLLRETDGQPWPAVADIPPMGAEIRVGQPVATVFATGSGTREVHENLHTAAAELQRRCETCRC